MGGGAGWADQASLEVRDLLDLAATREWPDRREIWDCRDLRDCRDLQDLRDCEEVRDQLGRLVPWEPGVNMEFKVQQDNLDRKVTEAAGDGRDQKDKGGVRALLERRGSWGRKGNRGGGEIQG